MYFDTSTTIQKQARPFVYIQYPSSSNGNNNGLTARRLESDNRFNQQQQRQQQNNNSNFINDISSPSSSTSSSSTSSVLSAINVNNMFRHNPEQHTQQQVSEQQIQPHQLQPQQSQQLQQQQEEQPKKKKRQHIGYACDKCRERRVGCDRGKPICGQCKDRYHCQYSNHALRLDNVSMRQRLDELENQVGWLTSFVTNLEQDYRTTIPRLTSHVQVSSSSTVAQEQPQAIEHQQEPPNELALLPLSENCGPSVVDWAINSRWTVIENTDGMKTILTRISNFEDLSEALRNTVQLIYNEKGNPMYRQPVHFQHGAYNNNNNSGTTSECSNLIFMGPNTNTQPFNQPISFNTINEDKSHNKEHTFTLFESLNRYSKGSKNNNMKTSVDDRHLETDVMTRLIHQHHQCGFPVLVTPSRFEDQFRQGELKPLVLSSVFSHSVPHCCIYHPHLAQIQDFRELGNKFYNHSHDLLGIDEPANLSNIHQRTLLITYDLDLGRVRRAFLHIGIAIRMCFMLNLHRREGYKSCKSAREKEQSKRIFWTVWFYDNMVSHLFHDQLSTIKLDQISIDLPIALPEFNRIEMDQAVFATNLIQVRKLAGSISEESRRMKPQALVHHFKQKLWRFYNDLPTHLQFGDNQKNQILPPNLSIWSRRNYFCILLDYCQCWITVYRALLPSPSFQGERQLTQNENEAILHTSQAAVAIIQLFQNWFQSSIQSGEGFDCFFRPYLYHFMSAKHILSANVAQYGRSASLVSVSRAYLVKLLQLYQTTPTRRSFDESQLEKDIVQFLNTHQIGVNEVAYEHMIDEALTDDPSADGNWSIFSTSRINVNSSNNGQDDLASRCSSNSSIGSDHQF
ncbi:unnamed protein product [Mucor hiemalis]